MTIWFTAGHHFGHANILALRGRPFSDIAEMDEALIGRWNDVVGTGDEIWHLGGFAYRCGPNYGSEVFGRLRGAAKHLVRGSHDRKHTSALPWSSIQDYAEIRYGERTIVLFHWPLQVWHRRQHGSWALNGSSAGQVVPGSCSVDVDSSNFQPVSIEGIVLRMEASAS